MPDQLDMQVQLAVRDIRRKVWVLKKKYGCTTLTCEEYLAQCEK